MKRISKDLVRYAGRPGKVRGENFVGTMATLSLKEIIRWVGRPELALIRLSLVPGKGDAILQQVFKAPDVRQHILIKRLRLLAAAEHPL